MTDLLSTLRAQFFAAADKAMAGRKNAVLLDYPLHPNPGDHLIWAGERAWMQSAAVNLTGIYRLDNFRAVEASIKALDAPVIFVHGGGNWGDLYPEHHIVRHHALRTFPDIPIVQFPQSINYRDERNSFETRDLIERHGNVTLMWRDNRSVERGSRLFPTANNVLVPDAAFACSPSTTSKVSPHPFVGILRGDVESAENGLVELPELFRSDWRLRGRFRLGWKLIHLTSMLEGRINSRVLPVSTWTKLYDWLTRVTIESATNLVDSGRVIITDRLHGHIFCLLANKPHVLLPERFGKVFDLYSTWTSDSPTTRFAKSSDEAVKMARELELEFSHST